MSEMRDKCLSTLGFGVYAQVPYLQHYMEVVKMGVFAMWFVNNVPLGRLAPWVFGLAIGARPIKVPNAKVNRVEWP